jgi:hypothetical protein
MGTLTSAVVRAVVLSPLLVTFVASQPAFAHGGGLDSYGCHHNRKAGGYHCHRGPLAGQSFESQSQMLAQFKKAESQPAPKK